MTDTLGDVFARERRSVIDWEGQPVYSMYELGPLADGATATLRWLSISEQAPEQGMRLKVVNGTASVGGDELSDIVLWRETAPEVVELRLRAEGQKPLMIRLWNCWLDSRRQTQAWVNNAGFRVEEIEPDHVRLRCSSGPGAVSFDDLVVELAVRG